MTTQLVRKVASRGKYAPLYRHLSELAEPRWRASFVEIETILGFSLPDSARIHRPWWANPGAGGGHSHALAWQAAGWRTRLVDLGAEELVFERIEGTSVSAATPRVPPVDELLPPRDFGPWPQGFAARREQIYDDEGR